MAKKLRWMPLDNAAKLYPAARRRDWSNVYRLSVTLCEDIDCAVLQDALAATLRRFPSIAVRLRRGLFWYYLQELAEPPELLSDSSYPLTPMRLDELRRCAFRVLVYKDRIALELFHSITDGSGGLVFLKTLTAQYLRLKYGASIPAGDGVLDLAQEPSKEELEDSFPKHAGAFRASRQGRKAFRPTGTPESYLHLTCMELSADRVLEKAHEQGVSVTAWLAAAMMYALQQLQCQQVPNPRRHKPIKLMLPVDLRRLFPSRTLRNFAMFVTPELLPQLGHYTFPELCRLVYHHMGLEITDKRMSAVIATNVASERLLAVRILPLFIKNLVMKSVFNAVGESLSCMSLSNLGRIRLPEAMEPYVRRMDFILGTQATAPYNCGALTLGDTMYINFIRNIRQSDLELHFYRVLQSQGLHVLVRSNGSKE